MVLALCQWLVGADAWIICHILGDAHVSIEAACIDESLITADANVPHAFPQSGLLFTGKADWTVPAIGVASSSAVKRH
ncbi:MAG TPA: hypothetical protein ACQGQI_10860 [Xylella sp.]